MMNKAKLQEYTEKTESCMALENATIQEEVAREIAVLLGHGSSVQAIVDELRAAKTYSSQLNLRSYAEAYDVAIRMIESN